MLEGRALEGLIGRSFGGYRVIRFVAGGRTGAIFDAVHETIDQSASIKAFHPYLTRDPEFRARFDRETQLIQGLNHPGIPRLLAAGVEGSQAFLATERIGGEPLGARMNRLPLQQIGPRSEAMASLLSQLVNALHHAHGHGCVHGDVKPNNVLVGADGRAVLTDFGVLAIMGGSEAAGTGVLISTPEYMAPEQVSGEEPITPATDVYALAVIAFELLVGYVPFQAPTPGGVMRLHQQEPPPSPRALDPSFPQRAEAILHQALAKRPADRPSLDAFLGALLLAFQPVTRSAAAAPTAARVSAAPATPVAAPTPPPVIRLPPISPTPTTPPATAPAAGQPRVTTPAPSPTPAPSRPATPTTPAPTGATAPAGTAATSQSPPTPRRPAGRRSGPSLSSIIATIVTILIIAATLLGAYAIWSGPRLFGGPAGGGPPISTLVALVSVPPSEGGG